MSGVDSRSGLSDINSRDKQKTMHSQLAIRKEIDDKESSYSSKFDKSVSELKSKEVLIDKVQVKSDKSSRNEKSRSNLGSKKSQDCSSSN